MVVCLYLRRERARARDGSPWAQLRALLPRANLVLQPALPGILLMNTSLTLSYTALATVVPPQAAAVRAACRPPNTATQDLSRALAL